MYVCIYIYIYICFPRRPDADASIPSLVGGPPPGGRRLEEAPAPKLGLHYRGVYYTLFPLHPPLMNLDKLHLPAGLYNAKV